MENTFVLMMLTASIALNIFFIVIVIPELKKYGPAYCLSLLKMIRLTLQKVKYKIPENTIERLIDSVDQEINLLQSHIDGNGYNNKN